MTAPKVRSDHEALTQIAQRFASQAEQTKQMTRNLKSKLGVLEGGDWIGKGATKFYNEMNSSVLPSLNRLGSALDMASATTKKISQLMRQTEDEAARVFQENASDGDDHDHDDGDSTREKGGEGSGIGAGTVVGGIIGALAGGVLGAAAGAWVGNKVDNWMSDSKERSEADQARREAVQKYIKNDDGQGAVNEAIKQYGIDTSGFKEVKYDPNQNPELDAKVKDGVMTVGPGALRSPGYLASTIGHEAVHTQQEKEGRLINTEQGRRMNEVEAYDWETKNADKNGLNDIEQRTINRRRDTNYKKLSPENQKRADSGQYTPA